ncbi:uncharacterized protein B0T15DRAFT_483533 [Chaetomium strumarium]|uniref:Uncharacterized protein n=1 Tax=Chaetomium strumarium TaxID=1170767 RepID=A0AAJ0GZM7_9PEZI|nr:hypothetical protein B0T15DRAFT_483533 [Chaetomium strumarium]
MSAYATVLTLGPTLSAVQGGEEEEEGDDPEITLDSINNSKTINFSTHANYTRWAPREAFRELVQNWNGSATSCYKGRNGEGTIDITNRSATLQPWHLDLGGTSKADDDQQAGPHGEGLKLALLVLMRGMQNHGFRCRSGGFNWKFNFTTRGRLVARLHHQSRRLSQRTLLPFGSNPQLDVYPVKQKDFEAWTKAALFLQDARDGAIGLCLRESVPTRSASITNRPLRFGYNFAFGHTNRERQSVASANEEARAILGIWSKALEAKPDLVSELSAVLNTTEPEYADIAEAKRFMKFETARKWYYCSEDKNKNRRLDHIIQGLGCEGVQLADSYCAILRRHNLIRTAEEEEHRRFTTAPPVAAAELETAFAKSVRRLLRACVHACSKTNGIAIQFVQAGQLHLQLFYSEAERLFRVHERWLSIGGAIEELGLPDNLLDVDAVFHTVKRLFADALEQLPCEVFVEDGSRTAEWRRKLEVSCAEQRLLNYLRVENLDVKEIWSNGQLLLSWKVDPRLDFGTSVEIQCHSASRCLHLRDRLLTAEDGAFCFTEPAKLSPAFLITLMCMTSRDGNDLEQRTLEDDLEAGEEYFFVLLMPADPDSFVALSSVTDMAHRASTPSRERSRPPSQVFRHGPRTSAPGGWPSELLSPRRSGSPDGSSADTSDLISNGTVSIGGVSPHPTVAVTAPALATATVPAGSFTLGPRLCTLDVFKIDKERWYEARNAENVQAVIGILAGEKSLPEETKKRPRIE